MNENNLEFPVSQKFLDFQEVPFTKLLVIQYEPNKNLPKQFFFN